MIFREKELRDKLIKSGLGLKKLGGGLGWRFDKFGLRLKEEH